MSREKRVAMAASSRESLVGIGFSNASQGFRSSLK
jgi:hypothetical protein